MLMPVEQNVVHSISDEDPFYPDQWKPCKISFARLQEAEVSGMTGTGCEFRFLQYVLASARELQKVSVSFRTKCFQEGIRDHVEFKLLRGRVTWSSFRDAYQSYRWRLRP